MMQNQLNKKSPGKGDCIRYARVADMGSPKNIRLNEFKVPGSPGAHSGSRRNELPSLSQSKPGTYKPLLTSFHTPKTDEQAYSYFGKSLSPAPILAKAGKATARVAVILAISLLSAYLPLGLSPSGSKIPAWNAGLVANAAGVQPDVWWPAQNAELAATQPFKAMVQGWDVNNYKMYWQVDSGRLNVMDNNYQDYPHKEAMVDLSGWSWKGRGPYTLTFSAFDNRGQKFGESNVAIFVPQVSVPVQLAASLDQPVFGPVSSAQRSLSCPPAGSSVFTGCYYQGRNFDNFIMSRQDPTMNFDWGGSSPDPAVPTDNFSARWQGNYNLNGGKYTFVTTADDGVRIYVDNNLIIDQWKDQAAATYEADVNLSVGTHAIKMEYYENSGGSVAKLSWKPAASLTNDPVSAVAASYDKDPFAGKLYLDPNSNAKRQADAWRSSRPQDAALMDKIAAQPVATWFGGWNSDVRADADKLVTAAANQGALPLMIAYNIPNRDCGGYSAGGAQTADAYKQWIKALADGIGSRKAAVILEPDATALTDCLSPSEQQTRSSLLQYAVATLKSKGKIAVYLDAAHANWIDANTMSSRLKDAGISGADGFALNVSNFTTTQDNINYGQDISAKVGGKHFIIDTSRSGNGPAPDNAWCNPPGRALGARPTYNTGNRLVDAFVWGKQPGESDGACNGGPAAGVWWPDYALGLAQRAAW